MIQKAVDINGEKTQQYLQLDPETKSVIHKRITEVQIEQRLKDMEKVNDIELGTVEKESITNSTDMPRKKKEEAPSLDKFNVYKEKDKKRADYGQYKFYAKVGDEQMSVVASRKDLNKMLNAPAVKMEKSASMKM